MIRPLERLGFLYKLSRKFRGESDRAHGNVRQRRRTVVTVNVCS